LQAEGPEEEWCVDNIARQIKQELAKVNEREKRKKKELEFYENLWMMLNPANEEFISSDLLIELFKILFTSPNGSQKMAASIIDGIFFI
jgi:hypothetical protein